MYMGINLFISLHLKKRGEVAFQLLHGPCSVADFVLDCLSKFSKTLGIAVGNEDWVVAEAGRATLFGGNLSFNNAFKERLTIAKGIVGIVLNE